jgi:hypothetical protein
VIVDGNVNFTVEAVGIATEGVKRMVYSAVAPAVVGLALAERLLKPAPNANWTSIRASRKR